MEKFLWPERLVATDPVSVFRGGHQWRAWENTEEERRCSLDCARPTVAVLDGLFAN
jgi:hypothetical protein